MNDFYNSCTESLPAQPKTLKKGRSKIYICRVELVPLVFFVFSSKKQAVGSLDEKAGLLCAAKKRHSGGGRPKDGGPASGGRTACEEKGVMAVRGGACRFLKETPGAEKGGLSGTRKKEGDFVNKE